MVFAENKLMPRTGRILISEPFLGDGYFRRAVVLLVEHNDKGSVGFILNKPLDITIDEAIPGFPSFDFNTMFGGPVSRDQLYFVHTLGDKIKDSVPIADGLWWLGDFDQVKVMLDNKEISVNEMRFFIGYAGWDKGQLLKEMEERSWFVSEVDLDMIFSADPENMWQEAVKKMGAEYKLMADFPEDPSLN
ncbi:MAG TPA: YqgE/AlgH family protein [Bacteroidia bacterium]|jgi:putative transcriptional regulator|nr:YqgE/AlgH family protein [Bacteroidia bacterium]